MELGVFGVIIFIVTVVVGVGSTYYLKLKNDNPIEEIAEKIIEEQTGIDIDLSPRTPEKRVLDKSKDKKSKDKE